ALALTVMIGIDTQSANADLIELSMVVREVSDQEADAGAPVGGFVHDFYATTDGDILSIGLVDITANLYNDGFGTDNAPPIEALIPTFPQLAADSWITTPGNTSVLGSDGFPGNGDTAWGDTSNNGPQDGFQFARLTTLPGEVGTFSGQFSIA